MLQTIFKLHNGQPQTVYSQEDITAREHNENYYRALYDFPDNTSVYSYVELDCDKFEYIQDTLESLLQLQLIELTSFLPWFSSLEITPDYFSPDKPPFLTHRFEHQKNTSRFIFDFYLLSQNYELLSEKNYKAANRLKEAMLVLAPKYLIEHKLDYYSSSKAIDVFKI